MSAVMMPTYHEKTFGWLLSILIVVTSAPGGPGVHRFVHFWDDIVFFLIHFFHATWENPNTFLQLITFALFYSVCGFNWIIVFVDSRSCFNCQICCRFFWFHWFVYTVNKTKISSVEYVYLYSIVASLLVNNYIPITEWPGCQSLAFCNCIIFCTNMHNFGWKRNTLLYQLYIWMWYVHIFVMDHCRAKN